MIKLIKKLFEKKQMKLYHPSSPGDKVIVKRNWFKRKLYNDRFATLNECLYYYENKSEFKDPEYVRSDEFK